MNNFHSRLTKMVLCCLICRIICLPLQAEQVKFIVDLEITGAGQKIFLIEKEIKRIQTQLKGMTEARISFEHEWEWEAYKKQKQEFQEKLTKLQAELEELKRALEFFKKKKKLFPSHEGGKICDYFFTLPVDPKVYEEEFLKVAQLFYKMFPSVPFSFQTRPQILIYKKADDYNAFQKEVPDNVAEHQLSKRAYELGGVMPFTGPSNRKYYVMEIYDQPVFDIFRHGVAHLFLNRMVDPSTFSIKSNSGSPFLIEGFAGNVAASFDNAVYEAETRFCAMTTESFKMGKIANLLKQTEVPSTPDEARKFYYGEAVLFVRWIVFLPEGLVLFKQLLDAGRFDHESILRNFQGANGLARTGFEAYYEWRKQEIVRLRLRLTDPDAREGIPKP